MKRLLAAACAAVTAIALISAVVRAGTVGTPPTTSIGLQDGAWLTALAGGSNVVFLNGVTAHAGGGQSAAFQLPQNTALIQVDTVASANDSVALPLCVAASEFTMRNNGANSMNVYASATTNTVTATTDTLNGNSNATAYAMPAASVVTFVCIKNGQWTGVATPVNVTYPASGILVGTTDTQTLSAKTLTSPTITGPTITGNIAGTPTFTGTLDQFGAAAGTPTHISTAQTTAPALTSCGTSPAITGTDTAGIVTMGTGGPTGCVITFNVAYTGTPYCVVQWIATPLASQSYATSNSAITLTQTATSSNKVQYICVGTAGG
jgi:hypothetical protein